MSQQSRLLRAVKVALRSGMTDALDSIYVELEEGLYETACCCGSVPVAVKPYDDHLAIPEQLYKLICLNITYDGMNIGKCPGCGRIYYSKRVIPHGTGGE